MNNMKKARIIAGYNQVQVADKMDVTNVTVSRWETGQTKPSIDDLVVLSKMYKCSTDYLLGVTDDYKSIKD